MKTNQTKFTRFDYWSSIRVLVLITAFMFLFTLTNAQLRDNCGDPLGTPGVTLDPNLVPMFQNNLPVIRDLGLRVDLTQGIGTKKNKKPIKFLDVKMQETFQNLLGTLTNGSSFMSRVWGYKFPGLPATYPGATIVAMKDQALDIKWKNDLPGHFLPVDPSMHMAHPKFVHGPAAVADWYKAGNVPTVAHLHGGHTESASDGLPEAWFTQGFAEIGNFFVKPTYHYDNDQEAGTLWYHDHALGITRLNVYAGLAGFYLLRDDNENQLVENGVIPGGDYEIEIVIQDRLFDNQGQLFWPAFPGETPWDDFISPEAEANFPPGVPPSALAEFFGNIILVNGMAWPKLDVEPRKYRFRLLNGSDSRFYILKLDDGSSFMVIGTDDALLDSPVSVDELAIAPGERYDVIVDFGSYTQNADPAVAPKITITNWGGDGPAAGAEINDEDIACPGTTGMIMQFQVTKPFNIAVPDPSEMIFNANTNLRPVHGSIKALTPDDSELASAKKLVLFEGMDEFGRLQPMLGTLGLGSLTWSEPITPTENPALDATEIWEVYNATGDAHPIHLHLVAFQILNREEFKTYSNAEALPNRIVDNVMEKPQIQHNGTFGVGGVFHLDPVDPLVANTLTLPADHEKGWKDTFIVPPGQVGRLVAKFDRPGRYVWHCHILSHEDHEMMRPFHVGPMPPANARTASNIERNLENYPNPFQANTQIQFELKNDQNIDFTVFDMQGKMVYNNLRFYPKGKNAIFWDGFDKEGKILQTGVYLYRLKGEDFEESKRLVIER